jgi:tetratricopeptide (TPR) repeat protein
MLETIREYGLEQLALAGEQAETRRRHAEWCLTLAERAAPKLLGPRQADWLVRLDAEHDNLRAALQWTIAQRDAQTALRLGTALHRFWTLRGHTGEGRRWLEQALTMGGDVPPAIRAWAKVGAGSLAERQGDYPQAQRWEEDALAVFRELGDQAGIAAALRYLGSVAHGQLDYARAAELEAAALRIFRELGDDSGVRAMLNNLGLTAFYQHDYLRAAELLEEALMRARASGALSSMATALNNLSLVAQAQRDYPRAADLQAEALELYELLGNSNGLAHCFENFALIAAALDEPQRAARLFGAAEALRARIGTPGRPDDREYNERRYADLEAQLGERDFAEAWRDGMALPLDGVVSFALEGRSVAVSTVAAASQVAR